MDDIVKRAQTEMLQRFKKGTHQHGKEKKIREEQEDNSSASHVLPPFQRLKYWTSHQEEDITAAMTMKMTSFWFWGCQELVSLPLPYSPSACPESTPCSENKGMEQWVASFQRPPEMWETPELVEDLSPHCHGLKHPAF